MKKLLLTTALVGLVAASSFGQGSINFKTTSGKNIVESATDGTTASLAAVPTNGAVGSFGTVTYEILTAPTSTGFLQSAPQAGVVPAGWTAYSVPAGSIVYSQGGVITTVQVNIPAASDANGHGQTVDMEIVAFTGTSGSPTLFGYSGQTFANLTTANGAISWTQATGDPTTTPAGTVATIPAGAGGFGSIVLLPTAPVPEPSTFALGGLAAAALLAFRRRK